MSKKIGLIIPVFNERHRLNLEYLGRYASKYHFIFVNDGSTDGTLQLLEEFRAKNPDASVVALPKNVGKAEAVRQGMLAALKEPALAAAEWLGYLDADMSTPLDELQGMLAYASFFYPSADVILASRVYRLGSDIRRSPARHFWGRVFATCVGVLFPDLIVYDSQCGAKLFRRAAVDLAFSEPFITGWIFDVELLLRLRGRPMVEYPLARWHDKGGGHLRVTWVWPKVLLDLLKLKRAYRKKTL